MAEREDMTAVLDRDTGADHADSGLQASGSLLRGLDVLRVLNEHPPRTLADLHRATGLPKPTLLRLLDSLSAAGYVNRAPGQAGYAPAPRLQLLSAGVDHDERVVRIAEPMMHALSQTVAWPSDLAVRQGGVMVIRASTRSTGPVRLAEPIVRSGTQILRSEFGLAYLAWCAEAERRRTLDGIAAVGPPDADAELMLADIEAVLAETRRRGYAVRPERYVRELNAIAVPILDRGGAVASLSLVFHVHAAPLTWIVKHCLPKLKWSADAISSALTSVEPGKDP
jgi:IclR family mhp operon transcriptional activator